MNINASGQVIKGLRTTTLVILFWSTSAVAQTLSTGSKSALIGPILVTGDRGDVAVTCFESQCELQQFDTTDDLAWSGNGYALPAVSKNTLSAYSNFHASQFVNDGHYGNGSTWIVNSSNSWVKIDLGRVVYISSVRFGRDRIFHDGFFDDRDPGSVNIEVALQDNVYAMGDDTDDSFEYAAVFAGAASTHQDETLEVQFNPRIEARYLKMTFGGYGAGIDEIEVAGSLDQQVAINIHPNSDPNPINLRSGGTTPVAIFGSNSFNVEDIDLGSLRFANSTVNVVGKSDRLLCAYEDIGSPDVSQFDSLNTYPDGFLDLVCHFVTVEITDVPDGEDLTVEVYGSTLGGSGFSGLDKAKVKNSDY